MMIHMPLYAIKPPLIATGVDQVTNDIDDEDVGVQDIQPPIKIKKSQDGIGMYESIGL